jgi:hypothetical protein
MENIEDNDEIRRKQAEEVFNDLHDLRNMAVISIDSELVFRQFLIQKLKDATTEFYKDMLHNLEAEGYKELNDEIIAACDASFKISEAILNNQIDEKYILEMYRYALTEAPKYDLSLKDITLEDEDDDLDE